MVVTTDSVTATTGTGLVRQRLGKVRSEVSQTNRTEFDSGSGHWLLFGKQSLETTTEAGLHGQHVLEEYSTMDSSLLATLIQASLLLSE